MTQAQLHRRPAKLTRAKTYEPFVRYEGVTLKPGTKPIWLYLRRSNAHNDGGDAIERHRLDLTRKLDAEGCWTIMGEYVDNDSASKSARRTRRGWHLLNQGIDSGEVKAVAVWKLDRTQRIAWQAMEWIARCASSGVTIVSYSDSDLTAKDAKVLVAVKAALAEVETDTMTDRQLSNKAHAAEAGFHHGGSIPFGWAVGPKVSDEHGRTGTRLVAHPVEFPALGDAVELVLDGHSLADVSRAWQSEHGITTAGGKQVYLTTILRALRSPRLVGYRMRNVPEHVRGTKVNLLDYIVRDAHGEPVISQPPVCDLPTWRRLQSALNVAKTTRAHTPWKIDWLLTGRIVCATCKQPLRSFHKQDELADGQKIKRLSYRCRSNSEVAKGTCSTGCSIDKDNAEAYVRGWLDSFLTRERLAKARAAEQAQATAEDGPQSELDEAREEREALIAQQGSPAYKGAKVAILLGMLDDVSARIETLEAQLEQPATELPDLDAQELAEQWPTMSLIAKRGVIARSVERIEVGPGRRPIPERVEITPRF